MKPNETAARKQLTPYQSVDFFADPEISGIEKQPWKTTGKRSIMAQAHARFFQKESLHKIKRIAEQQIIIWRGDADETYDATEIAVRREEEPTNLQDEAESRPPGQALAVS